MPESGPLPQSLSASRPWQFQDSNKKGKLLQAALVGGLGWVCLTTAACGDFLVLPSRLILVEKCQSQLLPAWG